MSSQNSQCPHKTNLRRFESEHNFFSIIRWRGNVYRCKRHVTTKIAFSNAEQSQRLATSNWVLVIFQLGLIVIYSAIDTWHWSNEFAPKSLSNISRSAAAASHNTTQHPLLLLLQPCHSVTHSINPAVRSAGVRSQSNLHSSDWYGRVLTFKSNTGL